MNRLFYTFFLLAITVLFTGCIEEVPQGRKLVSEVARQWQVYNTNQKVVFQNGSEVTMSFNGDERKSIFNDVTDCIQLNHFQEECKIYSMEYDHVIMRTMGSQFMITYAVEKQVINNKLVDCLVVMLQEKDYPVLKGQILLINEPTEIENEMEKLSSVTLNGYTYNNVYKTENSATHQILYLTESQGVVAFQTNETVWTLNN